MSIFLRCLISSLLIMQSFLALAGGYDGKVACPNGSFMNNCAGRRTLQPIDSSCEFRNRNGETHQGKVAKTIDNKEVCVISLSNLKQVGETCQLGVYNGWNPLRNWQVSGAVAQHEKNLICSVSEIPAEPQFARPPLPSRTTLLNIGK